MEFLEKCSKQQQVLLVLHQLYLSFSICPSQVEVYSSKMEAFICRANSQVFKYCQQSLEVHANISVVSNTWLNRN